MAGDWELVHTYQCVLLAIFTYISMYEALRRTLSGIDSHNRLQWGKIESTQTSAVLERPGRADAEGGGQPLFLPTPPPTASAGEE